MNAEEKRTALKAVKELAKKKEIRAAFETLRTIAEADDEFTLQSRYARICRSLASEALDLHPIRIALVGSSTLEHLLDALYYWLAAEGLCPELYLAPYDTVHQAILDSNSGLYSFNPDIIWLFTSQRDIRIEVEPGASLEQATDSVRNVADENRALWKTIRSNSSAYIIQNNADLPAERTFGNLEGSVVWGRASLLRRFNLELAANLPSGVTLFDLEHVSSLYGKQRWRDPRYWFHSKHAFSLNASGLVAFHAAKLIGSLKGTAKKCIVLDLDDTLWGGVIGDDGLGGIRLGDGADGEAYVAFQEYLKALKDRGILLAICSKNEMSNAKEPFQSHPDMRLRLEDISVFRANWDNKADNIREIADILNIGMDSMVFVDDNPAERELVRSMLPQLTVPEMPRDPAEYVAALDRLRLFEAVSFSKEDRVRGKMYRDNADRREHQRQFSDLSSYLKSLNMEAAVGSVDAFHLKRMAQLINKSNQFHLTGTRYTESQIGAMSADPDCFVRYFKLKDKFGDNGLISVVVLKRNQEALAIDTWVMSCRVLSRGMEEFICREILSIARNAGCQRVVGRYVPSKKNQLVATLFERLQFKNFSEDEDGATHWEFLLEDPDPAYDIHILRASEERKEVQIHD